MCRLALSSVSVSQSGMYVYTIEIQLDIQWFCLSRGHFLKCYKIHWTISCFYDNIIIGKSFLRTISCLTDPLQFPTIIITACHFIFRQDVASLHKRKVTEVPGRKIKRVSSLGMCAVILLFVLTSGWHAVRMHEYPNIVVSWTNVDIES